MNSTNLSVEEAFRKFEQFINLERSGPLKREYKLDRMRWLLNQFDNPQEKLSLVHVAGSKGKGSFASRMAHALSYGGKIGVFSSPHIETYRERIKLSDRFFSNQQYLSCINKILHWIEKNQRKIETSNLGSPSTFELLTLCAYLIFEEAKVDWAVIEVGMGGRLDCTNIQIPRLTVITSLELEHQEYLGSTIREIAYEKAGIIKAGVPCLVYPQSKEALEVITKKAQSQASPLFQLDQMLEYNSLKLEVDPISWETKQTISLKDLSTPKKESIQNKNIELKSWSVNSASSLHLAAVYAALKLLREKQHLPNFDPEKALRFAALQPENLGRFNLLTLKSKERTIPIILDGAHTPKSAGYFTRSMDRLKEALELKPKEIGVLILGIVEGKDYRSISRAIVSRFKKIIVSKPGHFKSSNPEQVYNYIRTIHPNVELEMDPQISLEKAMKSVQSISENEPIAVCGSLYMVAEIVSVIESFHG